MVVLKHWISHLQGKKVVLQCESTMAVAVFQLGRVWQGPIYEGLHEGDLVDTGICSL